MPTLLIGQEQHERCDFCFDPTPEPRTIRAISFLLPGRYGNLTLASDGNWNACPRCGALLDANDRDGLARVTAASVEQVIGLPLTDRQRAGLLDSVRKVHDEFWSCKL